MTDTPDAPATIEMLMHLVRLAASSAYDSGTSSGSSIFSSEYVGGKARQAYESLEAVEACARRLAAPVQPPPDPRSEFGATEPPKPQADRPQIEDPESAPTLDGLMRLVERVEAAGASRGRDGRAPSDHEPEIDAVYAYACRLMIKAYSIHLAAPSGLHGQELPLEPTTPAATWRERGEPDPHGKLYDGERAKLCMGNLSDDELANAVFMFGDRHPPIEDLIAGKAFTPIVYLTAAKERIRWLSRRLVEAEAKLAATAQPGGEK